MGKVCTSRPTTSPTANPPVSRRLWHVVHPLAPARHCSTRTKRPRSSGSSSAGLPSTRLLCDNSQIRNGLRYTHRTEIQPERMLMKRAIAIILETILFLFVFLAGSLLVALPAAHLPTWDVNLSGTRYFVLDGLVFMFILYVLFLLVGMVRHRLRS